MDKSLPYYHEKPRRQIQLETVFAFILTVMYTAVSLARNFE